MRRTIAGLVLFGALVALPALSAPPEDGPPPPAAPAAPNVLEQLDEAIAGVVARVRPAVVQVVVRRSFTFEPGEVQREQVSTSGTVWSADGYIVSLGRVFESAEAVEVVLASGEARGADLVGTDDETGLALVRIDPAGLREPLFAAPLGTARGLRAGSIVIAVSNPFGLAGSAAVGNIAGLHRVVRRGPMALTDVLQITIPVNPGDPGGLLANCRGEVVGVVASTYERSLFDTDALGKMYRDLVRLGEGMFGKPAPEQLKRLARPDEARFEGPAAPFGAQGICFAIPVDQAREVVDRLKAGPISERGYLGVQVVPVEATSGGGIAIVGVKEGSPAEKAGLAQYDVVLRYDGRLVANLRDFKRLVLDTPIGREVEIEVQRGDARVAVKVVLERRPKKP